MTPDEEWHHAAKILDACLKGSRINDDWGAIVLHEDSWKPIAAALRERDAAHEIALKKARTDAMEEAALLVERRLVAGWVPHGAGPAFAQLAQRIRALLEEAGK